MNELIGGEKIFAKKSSDPVRGVGIKKALLSRRALKGSF